MVFVYIYSPLKKSVKTYFVQMPVSILLLAVITFSLYGPYFTFSYQQFHIRKEIKKQIKKGVPENELQKFNVSELSGKISWTDGKREFSFSGKLYDVVKKEFTKDGFVFYCIDDSQETELFKNLDSIVEKQMEKKNANSKNISFLSFFQTTHKKTYYSSENKIYFPVYSSNELTEIVFAFSPPPEV